MTHKTAPTPSTNILATLRFPPIPPESCSAFEDGNLAGTASRERGWVALEQPGSWGRDILDGTAFDRALARKINSKIKKELGYRFLLIRQPGKEEQSKGRGRQVFIAESDSAHPVLWAFTVESAADLLNLPLSKPAKIPGAKRWKNRAVTLICAHAKRDRCCALRGRPVARYLAHIRPHHTVWECSHIGGHRYASTGLILPAGYTYGRLSPESALAATVSLEERNLPELGNLRGRSSLGALEQAAEIAVRQKLLGAGEEPALADLSFSRAKKQKHTQEKTDAYRRHQKKYREYKNDPDNRAKKDRAKYLSRRLKYGEASLDELVELNRLNADYQKFRAQMKTQKKAAEYALSGSGSVRQSAPDGRQVVVSHRDGRRWSVRLKTEKTEPVPASCGKAPKPETSIEVLSVEERQEREL